MRSRTKLLGGVVAALLLAAPVAAQSRGVVLFARGGGYSPLTNLNSAGTADVKNNIGPATTNNLATSDAYYAGKEVANYHLASGSAPINAGLDLTSTVPTDIEGKSRLTYPLPDLGAYEYDN